MGISRRRILQASVSAVVIPAIGRRAQAEEASTIAVLAVNGVKPVMVRLQPDYKAKYGVDLQFTFGTIGALYSRLAAAESAEVLMAPNNGIEVAAAKGVFKPVGQTTISKTGLGVCVRRGAAVPDVATRAQFRDLLIHCKSVAYTDPNTGAASGVAFDKIIADLGIAELVRAKAKIVATEPVGEVVSRGDAEVGVQQVTELAPFPGITVLPSFPADLQRITWYRAATSEGASAQAVQFVAYLSGPDGQTYFAGSGFSHL